MIWRIAECLGVGKGYILGDEKSYPDTVIDPFVWNMHVKLRGTTEAEKVAILKMTESLLTAFSEGKDS